MKTEPAIRIATPNDSTLIYEFIMKMARYEKLETEVDITPELIRSSVFEQHQAEVIICQAEGQAVGFTLFFHNYSTFMGQRGLYIEDIFVDEPFRGRGYGKAMFLFLARLAVERGCRRMEWVVLDWNKPSIEFYKSLGAVPMEGWTLFRLTEERLRILAQ
ncbi:MAG: GNAT family N-acetyltransferase [Tidjanibacter sp.]|nr:GNAT family N-acetyltransferase [Tidjanibacter sp.]